MRKNVACATTMRKHAAWPEEQGELDTDSSVTPPLGGTTLGRIINAIDGLGPIETNTYKNVEVHQDLKASREEEKTEVELCAGQFHDLSLERGELVRGCAWEPSVWI